MWPYNISGNYPVWATGTHGNRKMAMNLRNGTGGADLNLRSL